jgi:hypothetical protein
MNNFKDDWKLRLIENLLNSLPAVDESHVLLITMLISMQIRNSMEDFHVKNLSDEQMKELNPIIRQAVCDVLSALFIARPEFSHTFIAFLADSVPNYWEPPKLKYSGFS